jgi:shikimate 5-dehydrogenase
VYAPGGTAWTRHAADAGVSAIDGRSMLIHQALLSLERWLGPVAERAEVARAMRRAVEEFLGPGEP